MSVIIVIVMVVVRSENAEGSTRFPLSSATVATIIGLWRVVSLYPQVTPLFRACVSYTHSTVVPWLVWIVAVSLHDPSGHVRTAPREKVRTSPAPPAGFDGGAYSAAYAGLFDSLRGACDPAVFGADGPLACQHAYAQAQFQSQAHAQAQPAQAQAAAARWMPSLGLAPDDYGQPVGHSVDRGSRVRELIFLTSVSVVRVAFVLSAGLRCSVVGAVQPLDDQ